MWHTHKSMKGKPLTIGYLGKLHNPIAKAEDQESEGQS